MFQSKTYPTRSLTLLFALSLYFGVPTHAAQTDISDSPLSSETTEEVKPNILFTLDDSGSMNWRFMPDAMSNREDKIGFRNSSCNTVYYNPNSRYVIPKTSTGLDINAATPTIFTAAYENGFASYDGRETRTSADSGVTWTAWTAVASCTEDNSGATRRQCRVAEVASAGPTRNLSTVFRAFVNGSIESNAATTKFDTEQPAYYWRYLGSTALKPTQGDCEKVLSPSFTVSRATYAGGVGTYETSADHNFLVGQQVGIQTDPNGYSGLHTVVTVPTARSFTVALATNPGNYRRVSQLQRRTSTNSGASWTAWANVSTCTEVSTGVNRTECQVEGTTTSYVTSCTPTYTGPQGAHVWTGNASAVDCRVRGTSVAWNATHYRTITEYCTDNTTTTTTCAAGGKTALWRKVPVTATSGPATIDINNDGGVDAGDADERTNFANWYSYYNNRMKMMKSAAGRAFVGMSDSKRIGFVTINPNNPVTDTKFQTIRDFDTTQKAAWFNLLYSQSTNGSTPLREALSRGGRYFAGKTDGINTSMDGDPVQYSCQQNFNILTTDGYWNGAGGVRLDGVASMTNQDGLLEELDAYRTAGSKYLMSPRPIYDGASTTFTWNTAELLYQLNNSCPMQEKKLAQEQGRLGQWQQQTSQLRKTTGQVQYRTNLQIKTGPLEYQSKIQSKTGQLQYTTNLESRTGALEYQSKIQSKTGQLEYTTNLQSRIGALQYQSMIQSKTGQLQYTTNLQRKRGQLQYQSKIQSKTGQLQYQSKIESRTGQLEQRNFVFIFPAFVWSSWSPVSTCTPAPGLTECRVTGSFVKAHSCTDTFNGTTWSGGAAAVECATNPGFDGNWDDIASCTPSANVACRVDASFVKAHSCTSTFDGTNWTGNNAAVECNNTGALDGAWTNISTCTPSSDVSCQINASWLYRPYGGTCTSTVSGATWTGDSLATDCQTVAFNPTWTNRASCDTTTPNVQCRVNASFVKAHSCTTTLSGTNWTGDNNAVECNNTGLLDGVWSPISSCTPSGNVDCRVDPAPAWTYVTTYAPTCTSTVSGATWTANGLGNATECRTAAFNPAGWTARATCDTATPNVQCRVNASFVKAHSCTTTLSGTNWSGGASAVECNNTGVLDGVFTPIASCTPSTDVFCRINPTPAWAYVTTYAPTCTSTVTGPTWTSSGGNATECRAIAFNPVGWTDRATCDTATSNVQCRVNASFVKADACTTTLSGTNWTGGAAAVECNNTGALDGVFTPTATCTPSSDIFCAVGGSTAAAFSYVPQASPTCTSTVSGATWTSSGGIATDCSTAAGFSAWANTATCTESTNLECRVGGLSAVTVGVEPTVPLDVTSAPCNAQTRSGSPGSYTYTGNAAANYCETVVTAPYVDVAYACTPDPIHDINGFTTECQFRDPMAWANTDSCVINASTDCRRIDTTGWVAANNCVVVATPDATGQTVDCRTTGATGFKLEQKGRVTSQIYSGPNQGGVTLGAATVNTDLAWSDAVPGTCFAAAPAVPATATVTGVGPPTPPEGCTSGLQVWPCETYSSGVAGVTSNIQGAVWTPPGDDPLENPSFATFTTVADHNFVEGHSVTIAGGTNSFFRGNFQIVEIPELSPGVPDLRRFKVLMADNPGATAHTGGTASLFAGSSNTLADVAQYYYKTDLRNASLANCTGSLGTPICEDNVPSTGSGNEDDRANWQHMTTFTMGLGLDGTLASSPTYRSDQCVAKSIASATWAANVVTVTTSAAHGFLLNQFITVSGGGNPAYRGQARITQVPSATTFRYALTTNPGVDLFGAGTATFCPDFVRLRNGTINWPVPVADNPTALDDLWHAAVNGRGQYFSASDPDSVVSSLSEALAGISARVAAAAAAATSSLEPVAGDNFAYTAKYKTQAWTGDVEAFEIDLNTGDTIGSPIWSAQTKLNLVPKTDCDNRNIKLFRAGATDNMVDFKWNTLACDMTGAATGLPVTTLNLSEQAHFGAANVSLLSQFPNYGTGVGITVDQRTPAAGANLVNYLRGQRGKEGFTSNPVTNTNLDKLYRTREHVLGDIVSAQPVFVKAPFAEYDDTGYATFKSVNHLRYPMVYAAANDGMLHALWAGTSITDPAGGSEMWAFIPTTVLPNLYKLASENYATEHTYSVDGTPVVGDVYNSATSTWRTILVSGLNKGGKGYYALDITDPVAPVALWEFKHDASNCVAVDATTKAPATLESTDCHIGYTFNNPIISKLRAPDGRWVVFVTSGYNNVNSPPAAGDGMGYLYVLDAFTGKLLYKISTGVGSAADPSGLNHIAAWSTNPLRNNTAERIYGGDLKGNVWRFDVNDSMNDAGREATLLGTAVDPSNVGQPITIRPELAEVGGDAYVYVATGRYLGTSDLSNLQTNSVLALRDTLGATGLVNLRSNLRKLVITNQGTGTSQFRTIGCTANCSSADGWYADLPDSGERVNIDMKLQLGSLVVASNVPQTNACNVGGYSWINTFNNASGLAVANSPDRAVGRRLVGAGGSESLAVGLNIVRLPSGKTVVLATTSSAQQLVVEAPFDVAPPTGKRVSWREIVQ